MIYWSDIHNSHLPFGALRIIVLLSQLNAKPLKDAPAYRLDPGPTASAQRPHAGRALSACEATYRIGRRLLHELRANWAHYAEHVPGTE